MVSRSRIVALPVTLHHRSCLRCGVRLVLQAGGQERLTCSEACRSAVHRARPRLARMVELVLDAAEGRTPAPRPPMWGLVVQLTQASMARRRAEVAARALPGGAG